MKKEIHPKVHKNATVTCACGNTFETLSTKENITVEICSECHPFYTGQQKFVDTEGRIDKFIKKQEAAKEKREKAEKVKKAKKKKEAQEKESDTRPPTLKEMLDDARKQTS